MYEQISQEQSRCGTITFDSETAPVEPLSLDPHEHAARSARPMEDNASSISTLTMTNQSVLNYSTHEEATSKGVDSAHAATLTRGTLHEWLSTLFDALLSLVPLLFFVFAILCLCLDSQPTSSYGENVKAFTLLSPTIFPIVYAAILGKFLRRIGLFKAERSSTIGTLEQLIGSQSFFASLERQFSLRRVDFLGVAIIAAWLLSPLGGQSSLRLLSTKPSTVAFNATIKYHSIEGFAGDTMIGTHMDEYSWSRFAPLYMTALQTSRQTFHEPRDLFGNVRIPDITSLYTADTMSNSPFDWHNIEDRTKTTYTSLLGHPIVDIPSHGNISLTIESSYWEIRCNPFVIVDQYRRYDNGTMKDSQSTKLGVGPSVRSFYFESYGRSKNISTTRGRRVEFGFNYLSKASSSQVINSTCTATLQLVESYVECENAACSVRRMRNLDRDTSSWFGKPADSFYPRINWTQLFIYLCLYMPAADLKSTTRTSELVEQFMADPYLVTMTNSGDGSNMKIYWVNLADISTEVFSQRLQVAMNTFWDSTLGLRYRIGNLTTNDIKGRNNSLSAWNTTIATGQRHNGEQYVCNITFAALTIVISLFLFIAGSTSIVLGLVTRAPDILGYVSTYARDDPYFGQHVPSHLDGIETARALRDVRVIIGDVHKKEDVGHVAFASMENGPERVNKQRLYD